MVRIEHSLKRVYSYSEHTFLSLKFAIGSSVDQSLMKRMALKRINLSGMFDGIESNITNVGIFGFGPGFKLRK